MEKIKLKNKLSDILADFNDRIIDLNLTWKKKFKGIIDYKEYMAPKEKEIIEKTADQILFEVDSFYLDRHLKFRKDLIIKIDQIIINTPTCIDAVKKIKKFLKEV
ncbi:hypothetical protein KAW50_03585 [candidate division WOR-3 bacterium]|nr:hypothetical protein [candidate division WOR-3 bacterium]